MPRGFRFYSLLLVLCAAAVVFGCSTASSLPVVEVEIVSSNGKPLGVFSVEVASTDDERAKGLMFRRELGPTKGMLFLFPRERKLSFWMKNTLIPLDIIFVSPDWRVVGIVENATPLSEESRGVDQLSQYVLEFVGGTSHRAGISEGARVRIRGELPVAR
jgi:uncharacterized membrane protein (UPF0127 family)